MEKKLSVPILFLIFNRPDTTQKVFEQIKKIKPQFLYVAADGPRKHIEEEKQKCIFTRDIIKQVDWDCEVKTLYREENLGCKKAVSSAITWFFDNVEAGIILEDDCFPDLSFFEFCEVLLEKYYKNDKIKLIGGNYFQKQRFSDWDASYYFSKYPHIWGWASWRRAWKEYDVEMMNYDSNKFEQEHQNIFNLDSEKKYWEKIFTKSSLGQINTWDYQLTYSIWAKGGVCITPTKNLVVNLGLHNNSTHFFLEDSYKSGLKCDTMDLPLIHPKEISIDVESDKFTFKNLFSHSLIRMFRLIKENKFTAIKTYFLKKIKNSI